VKAKSFNVGMPRVSQGISVVRNLGLSASAESPLLSFDAVDAFALQDLKSF